MNAILINSKTDKTDHLRIDYQLNKKDSNVLILLEDEISKDDEERLWLKSIAKNRAFDFLKEPVEDIYSLNDGIPLNDLQFNCTCLFSI